MTTAAPTRQGSFAAEALRSPSPRCLVVMYHYVHDRPPNPNGGIHALSTRDFRAQLDFICRSLEPLDWPRLYAWTRGEASIPAQSFLLTFDDGLADHSQTVAPILHQRGLRGVFFVPGRILSGDDHLLPVHALHLLSDSVGDEPLLRAVIAWTKRHCPQTDWLAQIDPAAARAMYHYESPVRARLKYLLTVVLPAEVRSAMLETIFAEHIGNSSEWAQRWYMRAEDLRALQAAGHTIGGHGFAHEPLARLTPNEQRHDLRMTDERLNQALGPAPRPLSYPYGSFDSETDGACQGAGFVQGFTTKKDWMYVAADPFRVPRVDTIDVTRFLEGSRACLRP